MFELSIEFQLKVHLYITLQCKEVRNYLQHLAKQELDGTCKADFLDKIEAVLNSLPVSNSTTTALADFSDVSIRVPCQDLPESRRTFFVLYLHVNV